MVFKPKQEPWRMNVTVTKAILVRISSIPNLIHFLKRRMELAKTVEVYVNEFCLVIP
jgi:hypothetical protein